MHLYFNSARTHYIGQSDINDSFNVELEFLKEERIRKNPEKNT